MEKTEKSEEIVAHCLGIDVPSSPFLHEQRIERINASRYEWQEIQGAMEVVREGETVLELGVGIGMVGAAVAKNCAPKRVVAFEANPALIPHIEALYRVNKLSDLISVRNEVLISAEDRPDTIPFYIHYSFLGSSLSLDPNRAKEMVQVATTSYEALRQEISPDVILMDIEGGELNFLEHADLAGVRAIVIEFHPRKYGPEGMRRCKNILRDEGFSALEAFSSNHVWVAVRNA